MENNTMIHKFLRKFEKERKIYFTYKSREYYSILSIEKQNLELFEDKQPKDYYIATLGENADEGDTMTIGQILPFLETDDIDLLFYWDGNYHTIENFYNASTDLERIRQYTELAIKGDDFIFENEGEITF